MLTLSKTEMLSIWRREHGFEPLRTDCTVEATDGIDIDAWLEPKMRRWYLRLLDTAPVHLLPVRELSRSVTLSSTSAPLAVVTPPEGVRRVISVRLQGWQRPVQPVAEGEAAAALARTASPYGRPGPCEPLAVVRPDGTLLVGPVDIPVIDSFRAVVDPGPETYTLDESLIDGLS